MNLRKLIKRELIITIISVLLITTIFFGVTYAIYMTVGGSELGTVELGDLSFEMCTDSSCAGVIENVGIPYINLEIYPMNDSEGLALSPYSFIAKNTGTVNLEVYIYMNLKNPFDINLNYNNMKIAFKESTESDYTVIEYGEEEYAVLKNLILESGQSKIINVLLWAEEDISNEAIGQSVYGFVNTVAYYYPEDSSGLHSIVAGATSTSIPELIKEYTYTGNYQEFTAEYTGWHKVELWGAPGGNEEFGHKASGTIYLLKDEKLYIYVGEGGSDANTNCLASGIKYNGGGLGGYLNASNCGADGGGSTDVRYFGETEPQTSDLLWDSTLGLNSRIMVAAGGAGGPAITDYVINSTYKSLYGTYYSHSTYQSYLGNPGNPTAGGAAPSKNSAGQTNGTAGSFGMGGYGGKNASSSSGGGGGGGYYGGSGASGSNTGIWPGGGGSSFISGYAGVNAITSASDRTHTNNTKHYSGKYFIDGKMEAGVNTGNGKAKITFVGASSVARTNTKLNNVRYIKDCINGSTTNTNNLWVELQAVYEGVNVAYNKGMTWTVSQYSSTYPYSKIVDGLIPFDSYGRSSSTGRQCITVDLSQPYNLDEIAVWHYWEDGRTFYENIIYVSSDNDDWIEVINETSSETSEGKRVSVYNSEIENIVNSYINTDLVLLYDGISNTGRAHSTTTTTWKNLAGGDYTGILKNGPVWGDDYLSFDGTNDWVSIGILNNNYATLEAVYSLNVLNTKQYIVSNVQSGGIGISFYDSFLPAGQVHLSGSFTYLYAPAITQNKIYNSSLTYNGTNIYLYQNAIEVDSEAKNGVIGIPGSSTIMALGTDPSGSDASGSYLNGKIYSIRIYSRALTEEEIIHNYEVDKLRFNLE